MFATNSAGLNSPQLGRGICVGLNLIFILLPESILQPLRYGKSENKRPSDNIACTVVVCFMEFLFPLRWANDFNLFRLIDSVSVAGI